MKFNHLTLSYLLLFTSTSGIIANAQLLNTFNININNGLPSNHTYEIITDRYGYLWIATEKGVVRYNGYESKLFNLSDGLPTEDVWQLLEDKKGRIWLGNISDEMGYIYNNKYHKTARKGIIGTMYPKKITALGNGIIFTNGNVNSYNYNAICLEDHDTIYQYNPDESLFFTSDEAKKSRRISVYYTEKGEPILLYHNCIYKITTYSIPLRAHLLFKLGSDSLELQLVRNISFILGDYFFSYSPGIKSDKFLLIDLSNGKAKTINIHDFGVEDTIQYMYNDIPNNVLVVIAKNSILHLECKNGIKLAGSFTINDLVHNRDIDGSKIRSFNTNSLWGNCIGSTTNGLWINANIKNNFIPEDNINLGNYKYLGGMQDSMYFWWDPTISTLAKVEKNNKIKYYTFNNIGYIKNIAPYNSDTLLISGASSYWFIVSTGKIILLDTRYTSNLVYSITNSNDTVFALCTNGFCTIKYTVSGFSTHFLDRDNRYKALVYDSLRKSYWAYNYDHIFIHRNDKDTLISKEQLSFLGIKKVEKIAIDNKYGNIFLKGLNNIVMYDYNNNTYRELFNNINLEESNIFIYNSTLIVAGRLGLLFCKITGPQQISAPLEYPNLKNINYNYIYDCQVSWGKLLLNTDKGTYSVDIPSDKKILDADQGSSFYSYKFIVNYKDSIFNTRSNDTIAIDQKDLKLQFDIINPYGNGKVRYAYQLQGDSFWHDLNSNELNLPLLHPDNYYTLSIIATDNVWKSDKMILTLFIKPYWWQTYVGKRLVWSCVILLVLLLLTTSVLVTRKLVLKASKQRNLRMQLELKSIYAQINPHFIFNSLNSALLLVSKNKMTEAYNHISKFSRLLRAYIKSSRNKYITIAEEIDNLKDYLELQQVRFKNKFEYEIIIDPSISPGDIQIPSLLLQPFVENAINHGILEKKGLGSLTIKFNHSEEKNEIICSIEDNGIGRKQSKLINERQLNREGSYGNLLIQDLVDIFNEYENMNIAIRYIDKEEPLTGTIVMIQIKNPHYAK